MRRSLRVPEAPLAKVLPGLGGFKAISVTWGWEPIAECTEPCMLKAKPRACCKAYARWTWETLAEASKLCLPLIFLSLSLFFLGA